MMGIREARVTRSVWLLLLALAAPARMASAGDEAKQKPTLHAPAEILKIMEKSDLVYEIGPYDANPEPAPETRTLSPEAYLKKDGDGFSLLSFSLSEEAKEILNNARAAYTSKEYDSALKLYKSLLEKAPEYHHARTLLGNVYYDQGIYPEAQKLFLEAIELNFADYQAHWFLADTYWKLGEKDKALRSLTIAHVMNPNHDALKKKLVPYREQIGRPWQDWAFVPHFALAKKGKTVKVKSEVEWVLYAMVKAVWAYEPGYAEAMEGPDFANHLISMPQEKEALLALAAGAEKAGEQAKRIEKIILDGYIDEFIYYEMLARRSPDAMVLMPRDVYMRIVDYVSTYH